MSRRRSASYGGQARGAREGRILKLTVNGEAYEHRGDGTLLSLLDEMGVDPERVAAMLNDRVVPKAERGTAHLAPGDRVELLTFAPGG